MSARDDNRRRVLSEKSRNQKVSIKNERNLNIKKKSPYRKSSIEACLTLPPGCVHLSVTGSRFETTINFEGIIIYKLEKNNRMQFEASKLSSHDVCPRNRSIAGQG
jgi:hypothetical protein